MADKKRILKISVEELEYVLSMLNANQQIIMSNQSLLMNKFIQKIDYLHTLLERQQLSKCKTGGKNGKKKARNLSHS